MAEQSQPLPENVPANLGMNVEVTQNVALSAAVGAGAGSGAAPGIVSGNVSEATLNAALPAPSVEAPPGNETPVALKDVQMTDGAEDAAAVCCLCHGVLSSP